MIDSINDSFEESEENTEVELRDFLKVGNKISVRLANGNDWSSNTIINLNKDSFDIPLKVFYVLSKISIGDAMVFNYVIDTYEYVLNGSVEEINLYENVISISIHSVKKYNNKRKDPRFFVALGGYVIKDYNEKPIYSLLKNISRGGVSFESKCDLTLGSVVGLNIFISRDRIISAMLRILRKEAITNTFLYDAKFEGFNKDSKRSFDELLSVLEKYDDELFYNYIKSLN